MVASTLTYWRNGNPGERSMADGLLTEAEVQRVFAHLRGGFRLLAEVLYASGLRVEEALALRVRDVSPNGREVSLRDRAGAVVRTILLPARVADALCAHLDGVRLLFEDDLSAGQGAALPPELDALYPLAGQRWCWQFVFPSARLRPDVSTGRQVRGQLETDLVHQILARAGQEAGLQKQVQTHSLRHAYAARLIVEGRSIEDLQRAMGHANRSTTVQYADVLRAALESRSARPDEPRARVRASQRPALPQEARGWSVWAQLQPQAVAG